MFEYMIFAFIVANTVVLGAQVKREALVKIYKRPTT